MVLEHSKAFGNQLWKSEKVFQLILNIWKCFRNFVKMGFPKAVQRNFSILSNLHMKSIETSSPPMAGSGPSAEAQASVRSILGTPGLAVGQARALPEARLGDYDVMHVRIKGQHGCQKIWRDRVVSTAAFV